MDKHATLTYTHTGLVDAILTTVDLFSDVYDELTNYITDALWDTSAILSVTSSKKINYIIYYKSLGLNPVCFATLASILGPISSPS